MSGASVEPMRPEEQLCLLLARGRYSPGCDDEAGQLLAAPLDWDYIMELVRAHEILPLVCSNLKRLGFAGVPAAVQVEFTDLYWHNALRNSLLAAELVRVLAILADAHVHAMPVKGIALAESLYGDAALRVCADIDLLVPPEDFPGAFAALRSSGYEAEFSQSRLVGVIARYGKDCGLMRQEGMYWYPLQLHAGLIWGGAAERELSEKIWAAARRQDFHGSPAFAMSAEWMFLYLVVHAARHGLFPLKWFIDLDRLCRQQAFDLEEVKQRARRLGWEEVVESALAACTNLLQTPSLFGEATHDTKESVTLPDPGHSALQVLKETLFSLHLLTSPSQRLRFAATRVFVPTPADCRFLPLPELLFFLYYPLRPLRLIVTVTGELVKSARQRFGRFTTKPKNLLAASGHP